MQYWFSGRNQKVMQSFLSVSIKCVYSLSENAHHSTETEFRHILTQQVPLAFEFLQEIDHNRLVLKIYSQVKTNLVISNN